MREHFPITTLIRVNVGKEYVLRSKHSQSWPQGQTREFAALAQQANSFKRVVIRRGIAK